MKKYCCFILIVFVFVVGSCSSANYDTENRQSVDLLCFCEEIIYNENGNWEQIELHIVKNTLTPESVQLKLINNTGYIRYYGVAFSLEVKQSEESGFVELISNSGFTRPLRFLQPNSYAILDKDFNVHFGGLQKGFYRLSKNIFLGISSNDILQVTVEFCICE